MKKTTFALAMASAFCIITSASAKPQVSEKPVKSAVIDTLSSQYKIETNPSARVAIPGPNVFIPLQPCPTIGPVFVPPGGNGSFTGNVCVTVISPIGCNPAMPTSCKYQARLFTDTSANTRVWFDGLTKGSYTITQSAVGRTTKTANQTIIGAVGSICAWAKKNTTGGLNYGSFTLDGGTPVPTSWCQ